MKVDVGFGEARRAWVDTTNSWVELHYLSDGFFRVEGYTPDMKDFYKLYKPKGLMQFHTPAEHTFNGGQKYDVEVEIMYQDVMGNPAVVSIFMDRGGSGRIDLTDYLNLQGETGRSAILDNIPLSSLFDGLSENSLWYYKGSLTYPPCTAGVEWYLFDSPFRITQSQLDEL